MSARGVRLAHEAKMEMAEHEGSLALDHLRACITHYETAGETAKVRDLRATLQVLSRLTG